MSAFCPDFLRLAAESSAYCGSFDELLAAAAASFAGPSSNQGLGSADAEGDGSDTAERAFMEALRKAGASNIRPVKRFRFADSQPPEDAPTSSVPAGAEGTPAAGVSNPGATAAAREPDDGGGAESADGA